MAQGYVGGGICIIDLTMRELIVENPVRLSTGNMKTRWARTISCAIPPPGQIHWVPKTRASLMVGPMTGAPISGQSRVAAVAKSPVSGLADRNPAAGGFWPADSSLPGSTAS